MRNQKKWIAVLTVACMMVPSATVFATGSTPTYPGDTTVGGDGVVEYDPEKIDEFIDIVLPATSPNAYDFTLDPADLLSDYSDDYDGNSSVYFKSQSAAATLEYTGSTTDSNDSNNKSKLYIKKPKAATDQSTTELAKVVTLNAAKDGVDVTAGYYVWVPDTDNAPLGKFEPLTAANVAQYIDYELVTTVGSEAVNVAGFQRSNVNTAADPAQDVEGVFDGVIYKDAFEELTAPYTATDYVTLNAAGDAVDAFKTTNQLYITSDSSNLQDAAKFTALADAQKGDVKYTAATTGYAGTSDVATIVNKSSNDTTVKVTATLTQVGALIMTDDDTFGAGGADEDETASLYLAVKKGTGSSATESAIVSDGATTPVYKTEVTCDLAGAKNLTDYIVYQSGIDSNTGGHNYVRYTKENITYGEESFSLVAKANTNIGAQDAWKTYSKGLTGAASRPKISVVYHVEKKTTAPTYTAITGSYGRDGSIWFELVAGNGGFTDHSKLTAASVKQTDGSYVDVATSDLAKIEFPASPAGWATVTWANLVSIGQEGTNGTVVIRFTYDNAAYEVTVTPSTP